MEPYHPWNVNEEFNNKWESHLSEGHYGMDIGDQKVADYLNREFTALEIFVPDFKYQQIKMKFGQSRVYLSSNNFDNVNLHKFACVLEKRINELLK